MLSIPVIHKRNINAIYSVWDCSAEYRLKSPGKQKKMLYNVELCEETLTEEIRKKDVRYEAIKPAVLYLVNSFQDIEETRNLKKIIRTKDKQLLHSKDTLAALKDQKPHPIPPSDSSSEDDPVSLCTKPSRRPKIENLLNRIQAGDPQPKDRVTDDDRDTFCSGVSDLFKFYGETGDSKRLESLLLQLERVSSNFNPERLKTNMDMAPLAFASRQEDDDDSVKSPKRKKTSHSVGKGIYEIDN